MTTLRISTPMVSDNASRRVSQGLSGIYDLNEKISSGKKYTTPSDDPSDSSRALQLRGTLQANTSYLSAAQEADLWISCNELALRDLCDIATRSTNLGHSGLSDTMGEAERGSFQAEIRGLVKQGINIGNTSQQGKYIFNGYQVNSDVQPYILDETTFAITTMPTDTGESMYLKYGPGQTVTLNFSGEDYVTPVLEGMIEVQYYLDATHYDSNDLQNALANLQGAIQNLKEGRSTNGTRMREITTQMDYLKRTDTELKSLLSMNEDVDVAEAIADLSRQQTAYQISLNVTSTALENPSLFNFIS